MTNSKPVVNNKEKRKSRKKRDPLLVHLNKLDNLLYGDLELTGDDLSAYADALAGGMKAVKAIEDTIEEAKGILKAAMLRQYCDHYTTSGRAPDLRSPVASMSRLKCTQQNTAKVTTDKAGELKKQGIDLDEYKDKTSYTIRMGNASAEESKKIVAAMKEILGEGFEDVVSEYVHVGGKFFGSFDDIVKGALGPDEKLNEKMLQVLRVLSPTVSFSLQETDLDESSGFDLAHEYSKISAERQKAAERAKLESEKKSA